MTEQAEVLVAEESSFAADLPARGAGSGRPTARAVAPATTTPRGYRVAGGEAEEVLARSSGGDPWQPVRTREHLAAAFALGIEAMDRVVDPLRHRGFDQIEPELVVVTPSTELVIRRMPNRRYAEVVMPFERHPLVRETGKLPIPRALLADLAAMHTIVGDYPVWVGEEVSRLDADGILATGVLPPRAFTPEASQGTKTFVAGVHRVPIQTAKWLGLGVLAALAGLPAIMGGAATFAGGAAVLDPRLYVAYPSAGGEFSLLIKLTEWAWPIAADTATDGHKNLPLP